MDWGTSTRATVIPAMKSALRTPGFFSSPVQLRKGSKRRSRPHHKGTGRMPRSLPVKGAVETISFMTRVSVIEGQVLARMRRQQEHGLDQPAIRLKKVGWKP